MTKLKIATLASTIAIGFAAQAVAEGNILTAAASTGNGRLLAYVLDNIADADAEQAAAELTYRQGYGENQAGIVTEYQYDFAPVLRYDDNINDGFKNDTFTVSGFEFVLDEEDMAQAGLLAGISVDSHAYITVANGLALQVEAAGYRAIAIGKDVDGISKGYAGVEGCLSYRISSERYVDGCISTDVNKGAKSTSYRTGYEVSFTQMAAIGGAAQAFKVAVGNDTTRTDDGSFDQAYVSLGAEAALTNGTVLSANIRASEYVAGEMTSTRSAGLGISREIFGQPTSLSVSYGRNEGGQFLGDERREETYTIAASRRVTDKLSVSVNYSKTNASQDFFKTSGFGGSVSFDF